MVDVNEALKAMGQMVDDSLRFTRDHKGEKYKHATPCEWCMQQGLFHAMSLLTGRTVFDLRNEHTIKINTEPKKPSTKTKVVRRRLAPKTSLPGEPPGSTGHKRKIVRKKK